MKFTALLIVFLAITFFSQSQHHVVLKNGKKIECVVMSLNNDTLEIYVDMNVMKLPLIEVSSIFFAQQVAYDGGLLAETPEQTIQSGNYSIRYKIRGRKIIKAPVISNATEKKGRVVVRVEVDKYGNVLKAEPGYIGSTTSDKYLFAKAMKAAQDTKFDVYMEGPITTEGLIIIEY
ncbi:MAG: hypothetical protein JXR34_04015 [Bacteroidales bacterium]|nr:hypothetical protein [Bacteroidales bacterium]